MTTTLPLAVYGTLRPGGGALEHLGIADRMVRTGPCVLRGRLLDFGTYPAFMEGDGQVVGDLFTMPDAATLSILDHWERVDHENPARSWYLRKRIRLIEPDLEALVYVWNRPTDGAPTVPAGDWIAWQSERV